MPEQQLQQAQQLLTAVEQAAEALAGHTAVIPLDTQQQAELAGSEAGQPEPCQQQQQQRKRQRRKPEPQAQQEQAPRRNRGSNGLSGLLARSV